VTVVDVLEVAGLGVLVESACWSCPAACGGISCFNHGLATACSSRVKLNNGGNGRPFGRRAAGSRSSSKNGCMQTSNGLSLVAGVY